MIPLHGQIARDAFIEADAHAHIVHVSTSGSDALQDTLGRSLWEVVSEDAATQVRRCLVDRVSATFVESCGTTTREARVYPAPHGGVLIFLRDVTSQLRAEQERGAREAEQQRHAELEQQLIGIVSHDMRNPLQVIRFAASLALRGEGGRERQHYERIISSSERALRMCDDLLDFTRIRFSNGLSVEPKPLNLHTLTQTVVAEVLSIYAERQVHVEASGDGNGVWDPDRLVQVVQNLVVNALQHSTESTPVSVSTRGESEHVLLTVHNGGAPIPEQDLPKIFEPFQRGRGARTGGGRSLGLGLHITAHIVRAHGGSVRVQSSAEQGTTFTVSLPRSVPVKDWEKSR